MLTICSDSLCRHSQMLCWCYKWKVLDILSMLHSPCCFSVASGSWIKMEFVGLFSWTCSTSVLNFWTELLASCALHIAHQQNAHAPHQPYGMIPVSQWVRLWPKLQCDFGACGLLPPSRMECCVEGPRLAPGNAVVRAITIRSYSALQHQDIAPLSEPGCWESPRMCLLGTVDVPVLCRHNHRGWSPGPWRYLGF